MKRQISLNRSGRKCFLLVILLLISASSVVLAQTAAFTYQGKLTDSGNAANGNYDLQFKLYDALTGGTQIGARTRTAVPVTGGGFTVQLDFALGAFGGADRFLEIGVRPGGSPDPFTTLSPRQPITSAPYAFHSLSSDIADSATTATNANQLGGVNANQYVLTTDMRLADARAPTAGSTNYIQNSSSQQAASNFSISGNGVLAGTLSAIGAVNTFAQYNIGNNRVLSIAGTNNTFAGLNAGANNTAADNSFFGRNAGFNNSGDRNSFFGVDAGRENTTGVDNSFFGYQAGRNNLSQYFAGNSFFGSQSGTATTEGEGNSFFGLRSGSANTIGGGNSFFGGDAGIDSTTGQGNTFVGYSTGIGNISGLDNTLIGRGADVGGGNLSFATAIGAGAQVSTSNTIVLGRSDGSDFVRIPGFLTLPNLAAAGITQLCRNSNDRVSNCSSSLRYKTNLAPYLSGLSIINRLRPISFTWIDGGMRDLGLGAEDVEKIDPLLVTYDKQGQVEGVKYDRINLALVNAVREQQDQIGKQQHQIDQQQTQLDRQRNQMEQQRLQIESLKQFFCLEHLKTNVCQ